MAIGLFNALKMNQWLSSRAAQAYGWEAHQNGASGYTIGFSDDYKIFALRYSKPSPLNEPSQRIQTSLCSADSPLLSSPQCLQQLVHGFPATIRRLSFKGISPKKQISSVLLQMPRCFCQSCRAPLHATDKHSECVLCLGVTHAETALTALGRNVTTAVI